MSMRKDLAMNWHVVPITIEKEVMEYKDYAPRAQVMPEGSEERKRVPLTTGLLDYFPNALAAVAQVSVHGNEKHNPGKPLHWSREKSNDHADCVARHLIDRGKVDPDTGQRHSAEGAWRYLALLEEELEAEGAMPGRGSVFPAPKVEDLKYKPAYPGEAER